MLVDLPDCSELMHDLPLKNSLACFDTVREFAEYSMKLRNKAIPEF